MWDHVKGSSRADDYRNALQTWCIHHEEEWNEIKMINKKYDFLLEALHIVGSKHFSKEAKESHEWRTQKMRNKLRIYLLAKRNEIMTNAKQTLPNVSVSKNECGNGFSDLFGYVFAMWKILSMLEPC